MQSDSLLHVDLAAIGRNAAAFKRLVGVDTACCGVVKADAYGLGAVRVSGALMDGQVDMLAVFRVEEALELLREQVGVPLLVLGPARGLSPVHPLTSPLLDRRVELVVHDLRQLREVEDIAQAGSSPIRVHVEVDVGMRRGGVAVEEAQTLLKAVMACSTVELAGVMAQFTAAGHDGDRTAVEDARLRTVAGSIGLPDGCRVHAAATAACVRDSSLHHDLIRFGMGWIGTVPGDPALARAMSPHLTPAVRWRSTITKVHRIQAGAAVGYGGLWTAAADTTIGIVPVGYADGIPHTAGATSEAAGASVAVMSQRGRHDAPARFAPIVGAVNMDQCAIDLGDAGSGAEAFVGRDVEMISATHTGPTSLAGFSQACGVSPHQLLVGIGHRVRRVSVSRLDSVADHADWPAAEAV
ncbi:MAG: alanine racemase [Phycisphaerales bacterium]|jgi:alanine racemase|nr:alanine racemase [Phycisphaerales bacterium]